MCVCVSVCVMCVMYSRCCAFEDLTRTRTLTRSLPRNHNPNLNPNPNPNMTAWAKCMTLATPWRKGRGRSATAAWKSASSSGAYVRSFGAQRSSLSTTPSAASRSPATCVDRHSSTREGGPVGTHGDARPRLFVRVEGRTSRRRLVRPSIDRRLSKNGPGLKGPADHSKESTSHTVK